VPTWCGPACRPDAEDGDRRKRCECNGTQQGVPDQRTALDARLLDDVVNDPDSRLAVLFVADRVALFGDLMVRHKGLGPVHDAGTDAEHREGRTQAEQHILEPDGANG
jgi:hypothetical protein